MISRRWLAGHAENPCITWLGRRSLAEVYNVVGQAKAIIFPSECFESFGRVAIEAFAKGTPVIAADNPALAELVMPGKTGQLFRSHDSADLAAKVDELMSDPLQLRRMRSSAREEFLRKYTSEANHSRLIEIYDAALFRAMRPQSGMNKKAFITTSWDDGDPRDFRIAEMLHRFGLRRNVLYSAQFAEPNHDAIPGSGTGAFIELGAHTVNHVDLLTLNDCGAEEISASRQWIEGFSGRSCNLFCPPRGHFARRHIRMIAKAGFKAMRTVELLSTELPRRDEVVILPTTLQADPQSRVCYLKNCAKRLAYGTVYASSAISRRRIGRHWRNQSSRKCSPTAACFISGVIQLGDQHGQGNGRS